MEPLITVITPTHYRPDFLERCILAVKNQTLQNYEHFIFSDHCPYAHMIYEKYKEDKRITFVKNDMKQLKYGDGSASIGRNMGIINGKADIICYCDDDNILLPNHLQTVYNNMKNNNCIFLKFYHVPIDRVIKPFSYEKWLKRDKYNYEGYNSIINTDMLTCAHRKNVAKKYGFWKTATELKHINTDGDLMERWKKNGLQIQYINEITAIYNAHNGNRRRNKNEDTDTEIYRQFIKNKYSN